MARRGAIKRYRQQRRDGPAAHRRIARRPRDRSSAHLADAFWKPQGQEECLQCEAASHVGHELPVLVFIHGGSNRVGYASDPGYDGANLAKSASPVVVSTHYR